MKPTRKTIILTIGLLLLTAFFVSSNCGDVYALTSGKPPADSILVTEKVRQVLISQQLFVVKISKIKTTKKNTPKKVNANFKAELRDAFMIIRYDNGKSHTEQNWAMCPNGVCPVPGTYRFGTPEYKQLDVAIAQAKQANIKFQKETAALMQ
ncbi:hypothetical protein [Mucilaginibacter kameinonensis]|uniref:hypothetical protein n=1 Tax=Mucilaginibacter kameinonensis TaxID=452286 RepID=UPI000EF7ED93|nr:hypothetical protein [Mucilaginibacter kameinonensis]